MLFESEYMLMMQIIAEDWYQWQINGQIQKKVQHFSHITFLPIRNTITLTPIIIPYIIIIIQQHFVSIMKGFTQPKNKIICTTKRKNTNKKK